MGRGGLQLFFLTLLILSTPLHAEQLIIEPDMGRAPILSAINNAKSSVDIVMYGFTDSHFMSELIHAKTMGKSVNILLEKSPYKSEDENTLAIHTLQSANINLHWPNPDFKLTHQKTIIIDHHTALIMTFNLTNSSFTRERNFALLIDDPNMINEIENVFTADWNHKNILVHNPNLIWSPNNSREKLLQFIRQATSSIEIYAQDVSDYKTIGELARAARKGVDIKILTSSPSERNRKKYSYLIRNGVAIHNSKHYYIHAKVIVIDHHAAMLGSMNLTKSSIDDNRELSVITNNKDVIQQLENTFQRDWGQKKIGRVRKEYFTRIFNFMKNLWQL